ncbi:uncharacterized protein PG986_011109 [Apiospora aurea]|uniref:Uncharacterized protein n=1 Tax=Apiospora aurea TaxID=335848 RepID=A0ABR1Q461_9PEZI
MGEGAAEYLWFLLSSPSLPISVSAEICIVNDAFLMTSEINNPLVGIEDESERISISNSPGSSRHQSLFKHTQHLRLILQRPTPSIAGVMRPAASYWQGQTQLPFYEGAVAVCGHVRWAEG